MLSRSHNGSFQVGQGFRRGIKYLGCYKLGGMEGAEAMISHIQLNMVLKF
jgi:hypothetical protein